MVALMALESLDMPALPPPVCMASAYDGESLRYADDITSRLTADLPRIRMTADEIGLQEDDPACSLPPPSP